MTGPRLGTPRHGAVTSQMSEIKEGVRCPMCGDFVDELHVFGFHVICSECIANYDILE